MPRTSIVIPARIGSTRFPRKPLAPIRGVSLIQRVWRLARAVRGVALVLVATDDAEIADHVQSFGGRVVLTEPRCRNGTERVHQAITRLAEPERPDVVVNLQGDAVLTPPWTIQALVDAFAHGPQVEMATLAVRLGWEQFDRVAAAKRQNPSGGTFVVSGVAGDALYFSKNIIPFLKGGRPDECPYCKHIGIYGYRWTTLERYVALDETPLERAEQLEQLRALEHGIAIRVIPVDYRGRSSWSVDNPEDIGQVERIIDAEGELV